RHLARIKPTSYLALQAFVAPTDARSERLASLRRLLRDRTLRATTCGYGPRFLHSTGQLHKGGAPIGWFLQLTADHPADVAIPGHPYTFGQLVDAQAVGDFQALESHELPVLRVHLGTDVDAGLAALERVLERALATEG
ncbi:MAG: transaldolase, partial [Chloroflexota bacterium]